MAHIPIRTCIACNSKKDKRELIKIINDRKELETQENIKKVGRGAYICNSIDCLERAYKLKKIDVKNYERLKGIIIDKQ